MLSILINILIIGVVVGLIWWVCDYVPIQEPFNKILKVVSVVVGVVAVIYALLGLAGLAPVFPLR